MVGSLPVRTQPLGVPFVWSRLVPDSKDAFGQRLSASSSGIGARATDKSSTTNRPVVASEPLDTTPTVSVTAPMGTTRDWLVSVKVEVAMLPCHPGLSPVTTNWPALMVLL